MSGAATRLAFAVIAVAALLAGCTHDTAGDGAGAAAPGTAGGSGIPVTAGSLTAGSLTAGSSAGGSGAAAPETGHADPTTAAGAPAGPRVVTAVAGPATTTVTVPPAADPLGVVPTHPANGVDAAAAAILPGVYGLSSLHARVHGATIDLAAPGGCDFALDVVRSGQWSFTPVLSPHDGVDIHVGVLSRGDRSALVSLTGSSGLCTGTIVTATEQPLALTGTVRASGPARSVTVSCLASADGPPTHAIVAAYRTTDASLMIIVTVPDGVGTHRVDPDDQAGLIVLDPHRDALAQAASVARAFFDPSSITPDAILPGVDAEHAWFQGAGATLTVTSADPLAGTLHAPHLGRESGGGSAAVDVGFSC